MPLILSPEYDRLLRACWHERGGLWSRDGCRPMTLREALAIEDAEETARNELERRRRQAGEVIPPQVDTTIEITALEDGTIVSPSPSEEWVRRTRWENKRRFGVE